MGNEPALGVNAWLKMHKGARGQRHVDDAPETESPRLRRLVGRSEIWRRLISACTAAAALGEIVGHRPNLDPFRLYLPPIFGKLNSHAGLGEPFSRHPFTVRSCCITSSCIETCQIGRAYEFPFLPPSVRSLAHASGARAIRLGAAKRNR